MRRRCQIPDDRFQIGNRLEFVIGNLPSVIGNLPSAILRPGPRPMNLTNAYDVARQTLWVLLPEWIVLATAIAAMTAGAFVRAPRRHWSAIAAASLAVALVV